MGKPLELDLTDGGTWLGGDKPAEGEKPKGRYADAARRAIEKSRAKRGEVKPKAGCPACEAGEPCDCEE